MRFCNQGGGEGTEQKRGKKSSDLRVSAGSQTLSGSSMSPFRVPSPQLTYHFLSSTLHPLMGYQQIPPVYTRKDPRRLDRNGGGEEKKRQEGKEWLSTPYCWIKTGFTGIQEAGSSLAHLISRVIRTMG